MTPKEMERATALYHVRRAMELAGDDVLVVGERYAVPITAEGREHLKAFLAAAERSLQ
ncbi:MAG: hypothetical protein BWY99_00477 [Synergistetes bacterium ADurb.BinA166]|nr:MAG: hypothetical protein BWY99_00477 [Synergistetes bacterium ADurb.BinA166]